MKVEKKPLERVNFPYRYKGGKLGRDIKRCTRDARGSQPVGLAGYFGNPYKVSEYGAAKAVELFRRDLIAMDPRKRSQWLLPLLQFRGLWCACKLGDPCHADVLIDYANDLQNELGEKAEI